jgi:hypothetical protein
MMATTLASRLEVERQADLATKINAEHILASMALTANSTLLAELKDRYGFALLSIKPPLHEQQRQPH